MILLVHMIIALISVAFATYLYFNPTRTKIQLNYACIALTLGSGTYLLWTTKTHILQGCLMGLTYLAGATAATVLADRKLAQEEITE